MSSEQLVLTILLLLVVMGIVVVLSRARGGEINLFGMVIKVPSRDQTKPPDTHLPNCGTPSKEWIENTLLRFNTLIPHAYQAGRSEEAQRMLTAHGMDYFRARVGDMQGSIRRNSAIGVRLLDLRVTQAAFENQHGQVRALEKWEWLYDDHTTRQVYSENNYDFVCINDAWLIDYWQVKAV